MAGDSTGKMDARSRLTDLMLGAWAVQALAVFVRLAIPDVLKDEAKPGALLAAEVGADADSVERLLRALTSVDVVECLENGTYRLTDLGQLLRSDGEGGAGAMIAMVGSFLAIQHMPLADATALGFAKSLFMTIFAIIFLKAVAGLRRWAATVIGFGGVLIIVQPGAHGVDVYALYALAGAAGAAMAGAANAGADAQGAGAASGASKGDDDIKDADFEVK